MVHPSLPAEVSAAAHPLALLQAMAGDAHAAMRADGRELVDRALEAVERLRLALRQHRKELVLVMSAPRPAEAVRPPRGSRKVAKPHFLESADSARSSVAPGRVLRQRSADHKAACFETAWGGHLAEARVHPTVAVTLVGGGAEPRPARCGSGCAGLARREIRPKTPHGK